MSIQTVSKMLTTMRDDVTDTAQKPIPGSIKKRKGLTVNIVLQIIAMIGIGVLLYADAANWLSTLRHNSEISGYVSSVKQLNDADRSELLEAGYAYNDTLQIGRLHDPFTSVDPDEQENTPIFQTYRKLLAVSGSNAVGEVTYPSLGIGLPIYHGTSDTVISKGVGHMFGSSLPIGGPSTHSVLTAHSGLAHARLFTRLLDAKVGDIFWVSVLGEDHYYEVRATETVLPEETENLQIIESQDLVTLFTCAPIGINSHRFMVHAERIAPPADGGTREIAGDGVEAGFPWWALWFVLGSVAVAIMLFAPVRKKKRKSASSGNSEEADVFDGSAT